MNNYLAVLDDDLRWNVRNRKVICSDKYNIRIEAVLILRFLLNFDNDDVVREAIFCIHELYDETDMFSGTRVVDQCDIDTREKLMEFLSDES